MSTERPNTQFTGGSRFYVREGVKLPGVTSVINMLPKPFLVNWAAKMTAEFAADQIGTLLPLVLSDRKAAVELMSGASRRYTKGAGEVGTAAHALFEQMATGKDPGRQHPDMQPFVDHFKAFLDKFQPEIIAQEQTVWNETEGYAGSFDAVVNIGGERIVVDWKTTKSGIHSEVALQLAAYRYGRELYDGTPMHKVEGGAVLHVRPEGWQLVPVRCDEVVFEHFTNLLKVFAWDSQFQRTVIGKAL